MKKYVVVIWLIVAAAIFSGIFFLIDFDQEIELPEIKISVSDRQVFTVGESFNVLFESDPGDEFYGSLITAGSLNPEVVEVSIRTRRVLITCVEEGIGTIDLVYSGQKNWELFSLENKHVTAEDVVCVESHKLGQDRGFKTTDESIPIIRVTANGYSGLTEIEVRRDGRDSLSIPAVLLYVGEPADAAGWRLTKYANIFRLTRGKYKKFDPQPLINKMAPVLQNAKLVEIFDDNNQVLDVFKENEIENVTLLHFDTHSDFVFRRSTKTISTEIENYVNTLVAENLINEMYWILPEWTTSEQAHNFFWKENLGIPGFEHNYETYPAMLEVFFSPDGTIEYQESQSVNARKTILRKTILDDLNTNISGPVFADIDLDYFGNTGYDTRGNARYNYSESELAQVVGSLFDKLAVLNVEYITFSRSPGYTPGEDIVFIEELVKEALNL